MDIISFVRPARKVINLSEAETEKKEKRKKRRYSWDDENGPKSHEPQSENTEIDERWLRPKPQAKELFSHDDLKFLRDATAEEMEKRIKDIVEGR